MTPSVVSVASVTQSTANGQTNGQPPCVLQAQGVRKTFREGGLQVEVLRGVDLEVQAGERVAIVGASGSGKSTLLHVLGGLELASSGTVQVCGRNWAQMGAAEQSAWRNQQLGFIYQFHHLLPEFSALENVAMPLRIRRLDESQTLARAQAALTQVGLGERLAHAPGQLSGGERQRCAVARALVTAPRLLLADEPTGNLDRGNAERVFSLMLDQAQATQAAVLIVTHDHSLASRCERVLQLNDGVLVAA